MTKSIGILLGQAIVVPALLAASPSASAQTSAEAAAAATESKEGLEEVVVTGSRIRRSATDTSNPVVMVDQQLLTDRGFVSAAQALNQLTSANPALNLAPGNGDPSGAGRQFPQLFGLGTGRTLTLVNGRRMVTSSSGLGDAQVDANIIPTGLLDRVEVVQGSGAAVYGSDAIAGVVNYVLKRNFEGLELDAQLGNAERGDYEVKNARATWGSNFAEERGNVALNVEWSDTPKLGYTARPRGALARITGTNAADTGPNDGIPSVREILDARFWNFNENGVIYNTPAPVLPLMTSLNGNQLQFAPNGSVVVYRPGTLNGVPFAAGGDGFSYANLVPTIRSGVERVVANALGHFDFNDRLTLHGELLFATTEGVETPQGESHTILNAAATGAGPITFTINNPFLTPEAIATLSTANPMFAAGAPLFLSKMFTDLVPGADQTSDTETMRAIVGLDGGFAWGGRDMRWGISASQARVEGETRRWQVNTARYNLAINAAGQIVCAVNADAITTNDDAACAPINPFGQGNVSQAARDYLDVMSGQDYTNDQTDILATLDGPLFTLPAGELKFALAYEHRREKVDFRPLEANLLGLFDAGVPEVGQSGKYRTNEFSLELAVPILGDDVVLPLVRELELSGAFRSVDNSLAGTEDVWSTGLRWEVVDGFTLRGALSRNFRAPTLTQLVAPQVTSLTSVGQDPCDADRINGGPNPAVRRANCQALFAANPAYGALATFQDPAENFTRALITTGGNPDLRNEISDTVSFGFVLQPAILPGLTIVADRIDIELEDGLSAFTVQNFAETCYDTSPQPADICATFTRLAAPDGLSPAGTIVTGRTTTFNAGVIKFRGEVYNINYQFQPGALGRFEVGLEAMHTGLLTTSVTGTTFTRTDDTTAQPDWSARLDLRWTQGPWRASYQLVYLSDVLRVANATVENDPNPFVDQNVTHNLSGQYDFGQFQVRAGINNLTDEEPSYPTLNYGDIIGRQWFLGLRARF